MRTVTEEQPSAPTSVAEGTARIETTADFGRLLDRLGDECVENLGDRDYDGCDGDLPVEVHAQLTITLADDSPDDGEADRDD